MPQIRRRLIVTLAFVIVVASITYLSAAWTTPRTWVSGEVVTASQLNTHVRDNLNYLYGLVSVIPRARIYKSAAQSISDSTLTVLSFNTETYDVGPLHDTVTNNSRLTVPTSGDGLFLITVNISFANNATGYRGIVIRKNGTTVLGQTYLPTNAGTSAVFTTLAQVNLVATDYIEALAYQTSGGPLDTGSGDSDCWISIVRLVTS